MAMGSHASLPCFAARAQPPTLGLALPLHHAEHLHLHTPRVVGRPHSLCHLGVINLGFALVCSVLLTACLDTISALTRLPC